MGYYKPSKILFNKFLNEIDVVYEERDFYKQKVEELENQISENLKKDMENHSEMANSMMDLVLNHTVIKNDPMDYERLYNCLRLHELQEVNSYGDEIGEMITLNEFIDRCKSLNLIFKINNIEENKNEI